MSDSPAQPADELPEPAPEDPAPSSEPEEVTHSEGPAQSEEPPTPDPEGTPPEGTPPEGTPPQGAPSEEASSDEPAVSQESSEDNSAALDSPGSAEGEADPPGEVAEPAEPEAAEIPRWKRWGKRLLKFGCWCLVLAIVARVLFPVLLPPLLRFAGHQLDLEVGYEELNLSLTTGELELRDLSVARVEGDQLLELRHLRVDVATSELARGKVDVERVDLDGLRVWVRRTPRGTLNWLEALEPLLAPDPDAPPPTPEPAPPPEEPADESAPLLPDLSFFRLRGLRVEGVELVLRDETQDPPLASTVGLSVSLGHLHAAPGADPTPFLAEARAPGLLTLARAEGELRASQAGASLGLRSKIEGLRLGPLRELLAEFGVTPRARALDARARLQASLTPLPQEPRVLSLALTVQEVGLFADEGEVVGLDRFALEIPRLDPRPEAFELEVGKLFLQGARARAGRSSEGELQIAGLDLQLPPQLATFPRESDAAPTATPTRAGGTSATPAPNSTPAPNTPATNTPATSPSPPPPGPAAFHLARLALRQLEVSDCYASFTDMVVSPVPLRVGIDEFKVEDLVWGEAAPSPAALRLEASGPGIFGSVSVVGSASTPTRRSFRGGLSLEVSDLCPRRLDPYLSALGVERDYERGSLALRADLELAAPPDATLEASFGLREVSYRAGEIEWLGLDEVSLSEVSLDLAGPSLEVGALRVRGPRARVWRDLEGVGTCGFALRAPPRRAPATPAPKPEPPPAGEPAPAAAAPPPPRGRIRLGELSLAGVQLRFVDRALGKTHALADLGCSLEDFTLDLDSTAPVSSRSLRGWLVAPGLVERADLNLELRPSIQSPALRGTLSARGLSLEPLNDYLLALGVEGLLREGSCEAEFGARADLSKVSESQVGAGLQLDRFVLREGERELLEVGGVAVTGVEASAREVRVGRLALGHLRTRVERDAQGALLVPGLRLGVAPVTTTRAALVAGSGAGQAASEEPQPPAPSSPDTGPPLPIPAKHPLQGLALPRVEVRALQLGELALELRDASAQLEIPLSLSAGGGPLVLDLEAPIPTPAPLQASLRAPGIFGELNVQAALSLGRDRLRLAGRLGLSGIEAAALRQHLRDAGLEVAFSAGGGALSAGFGSQLDLGPGAIGLTTWAEEVSLRDGEREWLGLERAELRARLTPDTVTLGPNTLREPRILVRRLDHALELAGVRVALGAPQSDAPSAPPPQPPTPQPPAPEPPAAAPDASPPPPAQLPEVLPKRIRAALAELRLPTVEIPTTTLERARLVWEDQTLARPETLTLESSASLGPGTLTPALALSSLPYRLSVALPGVLESSRLEGQLSGDTEGGYRVAGEFELQGLRAGPLAQVLPPELGVEFERGACGAAFEAALGLHAERGLQAQGALTKVRLRDGERSLFRLAEASFTLRQLAPSTRKIDLESLVLRGLELDLDLDERQALHALGLRLGPGVSPREEAPAPSPEDTAEQTPAPNPTPQQEPADPRAQARAARLLARASRSGARRLQAELPEFSLERLEVGLRRISLRRPQAAPIVITNLELRNPAPLRLPAGDLAGAPTWTLRTEVGVAPIVSRVVVEARLRPFALDPSLEVTWDLKGIQGAGVRATLPELEGTVLDGPIAATTKGALRAELITRRREPLDFHFAQAGFAARLELSGIEFREAGSEGDPPLAGLERLSVDVREVHPTRGVFVSEIEVVRPQGRFRRDARGVHALGFTIPLPEASQEPAPQEAKQEPATPREGRAPAPAATPGPPPADAPPAAPKFEVRIDQVNVSKIDVAVFDESFDPPVRIPLSDLEVSVKGLTSKLLSEKGQLELECEVLGGPIPVPGLEAPVPAWRRIFVELRAGLFPKPTANLELEVVGVQLTNYAGVAKSLGADLEGGQLSVEATVRLTEDSRLHLASTTTLHDLTLSEGEEGPVRSWLGLPFPVGPAIETAKLINGETLRVPVNPTPLDLQDLTLARLLAYGTLQIPRLFGEGFATILTDAVLAAPKRLVGGLTDLGQGIGNMTGLTSAEGPRQVEEIEFPAGVETLSPETVSQLLSVRERLLATPGAKVQLEHTLGELDLARARKLATPPPHDRLALARRSQRRVRELRRELLILEAEAAEYRAAGSTLAFQATRKRFRALALRLAQAERTLDEAYALLDESEGSPRRVAATCVALGRLRLKSVQQALVGDEPELLERITLRRVRYEAKPEVNRGRVSFRWRE